MVIWFGNMFHMNRKEKFHDLVLEQRSGNSKDDRYIFNIWFGMGALNTNEYILKRNQKRKISCEILRANDLG